MQQYSAAFTSEWLLKNEMRIVLNLDHQGMTPAEIRFKVMGENLFQMKRPGTINTALKIINRRLRFLDPELRSIFLDRRYNDHSAIMLYSFLKCYRLPREFVLEVLGHKWLNRKNRLYHGELVSFFELKEDQSAIVSRWAPETQKKLRRVMLHFLSECGLLQSQKGHWLITPVPLSDRLRVYVNGEPEYSDFTALILNN